MIPGMNPRRMKQAMKQLGMDIKQIEGVEEVIIKTTSGTYVFSDAEVTQMKMQGNLSWQISGSEPTFTEKETVIPDEDVKLVAEQAGATEEQARSALVESKGDIAEAIVKLSA